MPSPTAALAPAPTSAIERLDHLREATNEYLRAARSPATRAAYARDWEHFASWCAEMGFVPLGAEPGTVALYLASLAEDGKSTSTIGRRAAAIAAAHREAGLDSPTEHPGVRQVLRGIRRSDERDRAQKAPLTTSELRRLLSHIDPTTNTGRRDRALLLVGFAGAMRRSELVAINISDLDERAEGMTVRIRRSKTDQTGHGRTIALPYGAHPDTCPVKALRAWLDGAGIAKGPVFRRIRRGDHVGSDRLSAQSVALIIKRAAADAGLDTTGFSGHSLRAGFATQAAANGAPERTIAHQTGHRSVTTLRGYVRHGAVFLDNAVTALDL